MATKAFYKKNGDRAGFVSKDENSPRSTRYGIGIDNVGSPYRGVKDREINTPLGTIDYGYDGDTAYAGITPNFYRVNENYVNGEGNPWSMNYAGYNNGNVGLDVGSYGNPSAPTYFGYATLPGEKKYIPNFYKDINTPLGNLSLESNYENPNSLSADFTPNAKAQAMAQALRSLLGR